MADDYYDFDLEPPEDQRFSAFPHRTRPYRCRVFRSAIAAAGAPLTEGQSLKAAFAMREGEIRLAALQKLQALEGVVDEPFPIVAADVGF